MEYLCKNKKVREIVFGRKSRDTVPLIKAPLLGVRLTYSTSRGETFKLLMGLKSSVELTPPRPWQQRRDFLILKS